jgi:hypothetical protein
MWALFDKLVCLPLMGGTTLRAFYLSVTWQIYETMYLLLRMQSSQCSPWEMGYWFTHLSLRFPNATRSPSITSTQLLLGRGAMIRLAASCWPWGDKGVGMVVLVSGADPCILPCRPRWKWSEGSYIGRGEYSLTKNWNLICWTCWDMNTFEVFLLNTGSQK